MIVQIDEHTRDRPSASSNIELRGPVELVFYDRVIGVAFTKDSSPVGAP